MTEEDTLLLELQDREDFLSSTLPTQPCAICVNRLAVYRCPRCERQTCSLDCQRTHKSQFNCSGRPEPFAATDSIKDFNGALFQKDIKYLDAVVVEVERAARWTARNFAERLAANNLPPPLLRRHAAERGITVNTCPQELSLRQRNTTQFTRKSRKLAWRLEWVFAVPKEALPEEQIALTPSPFRFVSTFDKTIVETTNLGRLLRRFWGGGARIARRLPGLSAGNRELRALDSWGVLLQDHSLPGHAGVWLELNADLDLASNLKGKTLLEFPVLHVVPRTHYGIHGYKIVIPCPIGPVNFGIDDDDQHEVVELD